ncbi:diaminohydroxyphosphoribosylaminopyrimidine deaminase/5-amino-6-(5-phosphoribosylamino)uracil reductase [Corynebacterium guangdongense]|uniref:Riboflavin biosynthesis protein RibD n=2 Tax=Corynebacterium guangdongense TaxID=1783348 RepID=A0ABU1ZXB1_9CORY|nr:diaminohydroxyphosphoribosylaminopyrimidine deaminase/5-amino-6-(5-phosphoribosylamino)uracil reductase [Corynebacterium guangdongense]
MMRPGDMDGALAAAIAAGDEVHGTTSPNPPVGAAILSADGELVGVGGTQPPGGPHAEVVALAMAGAAARGGTAVVTLEPCNHTGRTGPCSHALADAGIAAVHYVNPDPNPEATGGAQYLAQRGVEVSRIEARTRALDAWLGATRLGRPHVTLKFAQSLDGFTAAVDGSSQWITGEDARADVHRDRLTRDAIIIGTGTALADDPSLTARIGVDVPAERQPRRVVVGSRDVSAAAGNLVRLGYEQYPTLAEALDALWETGARDVLIEGGASLAASAIEAGLVDAVRAYIAPVILGDGRGVLHGWSASTLVNAPRFELGDVTTFGADVLLELRTA